MRTVPLSTLLPLLAGGCSSVWNCDPSTVQDAEDFSVTREDLDAALADNGDLLEAACEALCAGEVPWATDIDSCTFPDTPGQAPQDTGTATSPADTGAPIEWVAVHCEFTSQLLCEGRDHISLRGRSTGRGPTAAAAWLACQARCEAGSVQAFVALARELGRAGAPVVLVERCLEAACDEVGHARALGRLARKHGGRLAPLTFGPTPDRSLLELAIENAVEGCVRETWAALVAHWQARHAVDADVRAVFTRIASDETRHGELAWDLDVWLRSRLDPAEVLELEGARTAAAAALRRDLALDHTPADRWLGLPDEHEAVHLVGGLSDALWDQAA